ncbi:MAG: hypothetical protein RI911_158 [Candidatus Parcubacteria bacterium]|jgi:2-amino-4-hydroxy-6-hydroxymethyldihydropteridine diphosphokinase
MALVYIAYGSNDRQARARISDALDMLGQHLTILKQSTRYETAPQYETNQPRFINGVISASTELAPEQLLRLLQTIETDIGRVPTYRNGPRVIDLDILSYDDRIIETETLTIPHTLLHERAFVLIPWKDIAPEYTVPRYNMTVSALADTLPKGYDVQRLDI